MTLQGKIILAVAALVVVAFVALLFVNAALRARVAEAQEQAVVLRAGNEALKAAIAKQNVALDAMRQDSEARARRAETMIAEGRRRAQALRREAERLAHSKPLDADDCVAARSLMTGYVEARKKAMGAGGRKP